MGLNRRACSLHLGAGCLDAVLDQWNLRGYRSVDRQMAGRGLALATADCTRGVAASCLAVAEWKIMVYNEKRAGAQLADDAAGLRGVRRHPELGLEQALQFDYRACRLGSWAGCVVILNTHAGWTDYPSGAFDLGYVRARYRALAGPACRSGDFSACHSIPNAARVYKIPFSQSDIAYARHFLCARTGRYCN